MKLRVANGLMPIDSGPNIANCFTEKMKVKIIRSFRRRKTIGAREVNGIIHLNLPMGVTREEELKYVRWAKRRVKASRRKRKLWEKDLNEKLKQRAQELNKKYFDGKLSWKRISYTTEQDAQMFGNCNSKNKTIKISDRLLAMPQFVQDYIIVHELVHLRVPKHGPEFWKLVNRYPKTERARGYLIAIGVSN